MTKDVSTWPLRERRIRAGLSLRDIATYGDLNRGKVSLFERGRYIPTEQEMARYMEVLGDHEALISTRGAAPFLTAGQRIERSAARRAVAAAVRRGELHRGSCEVCGKERTAAHHRYGYNDPLRVVWLCSMHHGMEHHAMNEGLFAKATAARQEDYRARSLAVRAKYQKEGPHEPAA